MLEELNGSDSIFRVAFMLSQFWVVMLVHTEAKKCDMEGIKSKREGE